MRELGFLAGCILIEKFGFAKNKQVQPCEGWSLFLSIYLVFHSGLFIDWWIQVINATIPLLSIAFAKTSLGDK